jgi:hypothetical protein
VTQPRSLARGQQGGQEVPLLGEQLWRHRRVDAAVNAVQPSGAEGAIDRRAVDPGGQQLRAAHHAGLLPSDAPN